jgi:hypothetical protein
MTVLAAFFAAVLIAVLTVVLLAPEAVTDFIENLGVFVRLLIVVAMYGIVVFVGYRQWKNGWRSNDGLAVTASGGVTRVSLDSARDQILKAAQDIPGVSVVKGDVESHRGKVFVRLDVSVKGGTLNLPEKQKEINDALTRVVEKELGIEFAQRPLVQINLEGKSSAPVEPVDNVKKVDTKPKVVETPKPVEASPLAVPVIDDSEASDDWLKSLDSSSADESVDDDENDEIWGSGTPEDADKSSQQEESAINEDADEIGKAQVADAAVEDDDEDAENDKVIS